MSDVPRCGAKTRSGAPCGNIAGLRTPHPGQGKCYLHGGSTPIRHGLTSKIKHDRIAELQDEYLRAPDPLNIFGELALLRALAHDFIERHREITEALLAWHASAENPRPKHLLDIADASRLVEAVTRVVERIEKVRAANAVSRLELNRIVEEMGRIVNQVLPIDDTHDGYRKAIAERWRGIAVR